MSGLYICNIYVYICMYLLVIDSKINDNSREASKVCLLFSLRYSALCTTIFAEVFHMNHRFFFTSNTLSLPRTALDKPNLSEGQRCNDISNTRIENF